MEQIAEKKIRGGNSVYESGDKYGVLTLTGKCYMNKKNRFVECICECGKVWFTMFIDVKTGRTKSCGCKRLSFVLQANTKHGMTLNGIAHPIYSAWQAMRNRCKGDKEEDRINYTERGIIVCEEWLKDFNVFHKWAIDNRWERGLSLDRINNDGNYEPSNCRWATMAVQNRNTSRNNFLTAFGETKCVQDWVHDSRCKVSWNTIIYRITKLNLSVELAITKERGGKRNPYNYKNK